MRDKHNLMDEVLMGSIEELIEFHLRSFTKNILHGDDNHRAWLIDACELYIAGKEIPYPSVQEDTNETNSHV